MLCLLSFFVSQVATQVAVLISKVARVGIRDWPELFPALLQVCVHAAENKVWFTDSDGDLQTISPLGD